MVRKRATRKIKRNSVSQTYRVFQNGLYVGKVDATPAKVKQLEAAGYVLKKPAAKLKARNNPKDGLTLIYKSITRVEGTKGTDSNFPGEKFFHNFKRPYPSMYGTPDRKVLIIK